MNCEQARLQIGADPGANDAPIMVHLAQCEECAGYRQELREMDQLISAALRVALAAGVRSPTRRKQ
jgi:anti-sigma factor RsiW